MGIIVDQLKDQILNGAKIETLGDAVKFAENTVDDLSKKMKTALEKDDLLSQANLMKEGKKIVHKTSEISNDIFQKHKDKLPEEIKPLTNAVGLILESIVDITKEKEGNITSDNITTKTAETVTVTTEETATDTADEEVEITRPRRKCTTKRRTTTKRSPGRPRKNS